MQAEIDFYLLLLIESVRFLSIQCLGQPTGHT